MSSRKKPLGPDVLIEDAQSRIESIDPKKALSNHMLLSEAASELVKRAPGRLDGRDLQVAVVVSRFTEEISARLLEGCLRELAKMRVTEVRVATVPGAFEIPLIARRLAESGSFDALVALGAVVRGETPHFDYVCRGVSDGLMQVMQQTGVPVGFGVLTVNKREHAHARSAGVRYDEEPSRKGEAASEKRDNKGAEAARVAVEMARLLAVCDEAAKVYREREESDP